MNLVRPTAALLLVVLPACSAETPPAAAELVTLDPLLGGDGAIVRWLLAAPMLEPRDGLAADEPMLVEWRRADDATALERVSSFGNATWIEPTVAFLRSDAGRAVTGAEDFVATCNVIHFEDLPEQTSRRFRARDHVGEAAARALESIRAAMDDGGSASPLGIPFVVGAARVTPDHADALDAFLQTDAGKSWSKARIETRPTVLRRYRERREQPNNESSCATRATIRRSSCRCPSSSP